MSISRSDFDPDEERIGERRDSHERPAEAEHRRALYRELGTLPGESDLTGADGPAYQRSFRVDGGLKAAYEAAGLPAVRNG